jgi:hypothetical protein
MGSVRIAPVSGNPDGRFAEIIYMPDDMDANAVFLPAILTAGLPSLDSCAKRLTEGRRETTDG